MCYSALVKQDLKELGKRWKSFADLEALFRLLALRNKGLDKKSPIKFPKSLERNFEQPKTEIEKKIKKLFDDYNEQLILRLEADLFAQKTRQNKAQEALKKKVTKKSQQEIEVAGRQIERFTAKLKFLKDSKVRSTDDRIFPMSYSQVIIMESGKRVVKPMRYHLRPRGDLASSDIAKPGRYNARSDNLEHYWKKQFGKNHGVVIVSAFYENVQKHDYEKRELKQGEEPQNMVIEFKPRDMPYMVIPVIWDTWVDKTDKEFSFDSFAIITDEPAPEVAATGHDRTPIFLNPDRIDDWLSPEGKTNAELREILNDRVRPYYEHALTG